MEQRVAKRSAKFERTTREQLQFYMRFCDEHPELQARVSSEKAKPAIQSLWRELVTNLNALKGPTRSLAKWKETLSQRRSQILCRARKAKAAKRESAADSKGLPTRTPLDQRAVDVLPCIEAIELQRSNSASVINDAAADIDTDFLPQIKTEACDQDEFADEKTGAAFESQSLPILTTSKTATTTASNAASVGSSRSRKRVTPERIYNALLQSHKTREDADERALEMHLQTLAVLQQLSQTLQTISGTLLKLNEKLDKYCN